jgi:RNA polymerase sigma factor (sigma-70 family)
MLGGVPLSELDDSRLIERVIRHHDHHAFATLVMRHQGAIRAVLRRLSKGDSALADDLAQATFLRVYTTLSSFSGSAQFRTWLFRIACNEYLQYRRLARVSREVPLEEDQEQHLRVEAETLSASDMSIDLERALASLNDAEREAIIVCYYADMSHGEAALMLNCPLGTLKSHVQRGRQKLSAYLSAWAPT